jgi:hypothetical protein
MSTAVLLIAYNRPELVEKRLNELAASDVAPKNVILSVDGYRGLDEKNLESDFSSILTSHNLPFEVQVNFRKSNLGCSKHIITAVTEVLQDFENVIVVEDDVVISPCFLSSMSDAFLLMQQNHGIATIGGFSNFHRKYHIPFSAGKNYWRTSRYFSAWGWGTNRNFWENFVSIEDIGDLEKYLSTSLVWRELSKRKQNIWLKRFRRGIWDYNVQLILFKLNKLNMLPSLRIIDNEGFSDKRSTHTKHRRPKNLFGVGFSNQKPSRYLLFSPISFNRFFWNFVDSNLWAADGFFNSRAREKGLRTYLKQFFQLSRH